MSVVSVIVDILLRRRGSSVRAVRQEEFGVTGVGGCVGDSNVALLSLCCYNCDVVSFCD